MHAVCGIGNPQRFANTLEQLGVQAQMHSFADHYQYQPNDFDFADSAPIIMTEKDWVKCQQFNLTNAWVLRVKVKATEPLQRDVDQALAGFFASDEGDKQ